MKKILITGVNGLIGSHLARALSASGFQVIGTGRRASPVVPLTTYATGDLCDFTWLTGLFDRIHFDGVVHLAACSSVRKSIEEPRETFQTNVVGTQNLLEAIRKSSASPPVLLASSAEVYAHSREPISETSPLDPKSTYAMTKQMMEEIGALYSELYGLHTVTLRFFYSIGPSLAGIMPANIPSGLAYRIAELECRKKTSPLRVGTLSHSKDFIDMRDITAACQAVLQRGTRNAAYNICTGATISFQEIVTALQTMTDVSVPIEYDAQFVRPFEPEFILGSHEKLTNDTGWQPQYDILTQTLPDLLNFWRDQLKLKATS